MMTHRTKLAQLVPLTCSLLQFSPNSAFSCGREQSPATGKEVPETSIVIPTIVSKTANYVGEQSPATERPRVELPKKLSKYVIELSCESTAKGGVCDIYVVGVGHCTKESRKQVESIVKLLKPDTVFMELCENRAKVLLAYEIPTDEEMKQNQSIFRRWINAKLENCEFRTSYREANKYGGKVVLGDRPIEYELHMSKRLPTVRETLTHERDKYMSYTLLKVASESRTVVAVVGRGHLEGIKNNWKKPVKVQDIEDLLTIPPPNPITTAGVVVLVVAIISSFFRK